MGVKGAGSLGGGKGMLVPLIGAYLGV